MKINKVQEKAEYAIEYIRLGIMIWILYRNILFRCIESYSLKQSRYCLLALILLFSLFGGLFDIGKKGDKWTAFMNLMLGYGLYTVFAYYPIKACIIFRCILSTITIMIIYIFLVMCRRIKNKRNYKRIIARRLFRSLLATKLFMSIGFAAIMVIIGFNTIFGVSLLQPDIDSTIQSKIKEEQTIDNNIEILTGLEEERWQSLSVDEKLNTLQVIANIEQRYLGLPHELNVGASDLREGLQGFYSDAEHKIVVNVDCLLNDPSYDVVDTVTHEAYHSLQHRMVDAYGEASENVKPLLMFDRASIYKEEFSDYNSGFKDFCGYYSQVCEIDARKYAQQATEEYFERINEYLGEESTAGNVY